MMLLPRIKQTSFRSIYSQADDGPYYVHVLWRLRMLLDVMNEPGQRPEDHEYPLLSFRVIREEIQKRFNESVDTPAHFEKVQWFGNYWNVTVGRDEDKIQRITGPGLFKMRFLAT